MHKKLTYMEVANLPPRKPPTMPQTPLAYRMRPSTLDDFIGQKHLVAPGKPIYQIITKKLSLSLILWGPPGTGKTTLASIMANTLGVAFETFNASIHNKSQLQKTIERHYGEPFVLLLDEIHRLTKPIQDYLLPYLESGEVILIGATTENPVMSIVPAIRSRCQIFEFRPIDEADLVPLLKRATTEELDYTLPDEQAQLIANSANGDVRVALNILETLNAMYADELTEDDIRTFCKNQHFNYDKDATQHYDYVSAYSNSVEGSDLDAALYYLAVILESGDLEIISRRLKDMVALDVGLANPQIIAPVIELANSAIEIGLPRAAYTLTLATMLLTLSPKSDSARIAYENAQVDAQNPNAHPMPDYQRDSHYQGAAEMRGAGLMHNMFAAPYQVAKQAYLPADLIGKHYYEPRDSKTEQEFYKRYQRLFSYIYDREF